MASNVYGWREVSGYFDGDGSTDFLPRKWVLHPTLSFTDNFRPHLEMVNAFLVSQAVKTWSSTRRGGAWQLRIGRAESVRKAASSMLPFVFKKREELKAVVDYLGSRITGTEFVDVLNESVRIGNRTGRIRIVHIPYTRRSGQALRREEMRENVVRFLLKKRLVSTGVIDEIKEFGLRSEAANLESPRSFEKRCERMGKQAVNY